MAPKKVNPGDQITAVWANDIISSLPKLGETSNTGINSNPKRNFNPFDPIYLQYDVDWKLKINSATYTSHTGSISTVTYDGQFLTDYPEITVPPNKNLYYNYKEKSLIWDYPANTGNLMILEFTYNDDEFTIKNVHPENLDISLSPPFSPILARDVGGGDYHIALTPGNVIEHVVGGYYSGALVNHTPTNITQTEDLTFLSINSGDYLVISVEVTETGSIDGTPELKTVTSLNSNHFWPSCAALEGSTGTYEYPMAKFNGKAVETILGGSHLDHWQDIPLLDNTSNNLSASSSSGRVLKKFDEQTSKYYFRTLNSSGSQITIIENTDTITIGGNSLSGSLIVTLSGIPVSEQKLKWDDGLITSSGDIIWDIDIQSLSALTLSATTVGLSGYMVIARQYTRLYVPTGGGGVDLSVTDMGQTRLYVRVEGGRMTDYQDGYQNNQEWTPPAEWGGELFMIFSPILEGATFGTPTNTYNSWPVS